MKTITTNKFGGVQGDVPIFRVTQLSDNANPSSTNVVAYGESTGHRHEIFGANVYNVKREIDGELFAGFDVVVTGDKLAGMRHVSKGDHYTIEMTPGIYFIPAPGYQQVEYDGSDERAILD